MLGSMTGGNERIGNCERYQHGLIADGTDTHNSTADSTDTDFSATQLVDT